LLKDQAEIPWLLAKDLKILLKLWNGCSARLRLWLVAVVVAVAVAVAFTVAVVVAACGLRLGATAVTHVTLETFLLLASKGARPKLVTR
jgi:hypothetical protein